MTVPWSFAAARLHRKGRQCTRVAVYVAQETDDGKAKNSGLMKAWHSSISKVMVLTSILGCGIDYPHVGSTPARVLWRKRWTTMYHITYVPVAWIHFLSRTKSWAKGSSMNGPWIPISVASYVPFAQNYESRTIQYTSVWNGAQLSIFTWSMPTTLAAFSFSRPHTEPTSSGGARSVSNKYHNEEDHPQEKRI
ncbi:hypothetical protein CPB84DRAFT_1744742 [Gymnopilus junonius]|uniref:Uncharacterized protein n=1 Tax=Gymnopilus junonius TaxID=109634 RepID=A0A9P5NX62_GYMJU|nr:hypothetical protein CPB84DRAFT_1744742 [Gymnopilus junonius]